jgi:hypothetical protein
MRYNEFEPDHEIEEHSDEHERDDDDSTECVSFRNWDDDNNPRIYRRQPLLRVRECR